MKLALHDFQKILIISAIMMITDFSFSQKTELKTIESIINNKKYSNAIELLNNIKDSTLSRFEKAQKLYFLGKCNYRIDRSDIAYDKLIQARDIFWSIDSLRHMVMSGNLIDKVLGAQNHPSFTLPIREKNLKEIEPIASKIKYWHGLYEIQRSWGAISIQRDDYGNAIKYFKNAFKFSKKDNDSLSMAKSIQNVAACYHLTNNIDSALLYYDNAENYFLKFNDITRLSHNYNNRGKLYYNKGECEKAIPYFLKADSLPITMNVLASKLIFYENLAPCFIATNDYKNAVKYLNLIIKFRDSLNKIEQNKAISKIKEQYDNEKLTADIFRFEAQRDIAEANEQLERSQKNAILIIAFIIFSVTSIVVSLSLKNSRRKRLLALQEKELETQKNLTLLKEQEILAINAMVEGQEKERKRVAEDLHDNLGSVIATLKLHFDNLRVNRERKKVDQESLFNKTENLIDEAYQKVRSIAHAKNAGVIANQGLLVAVKLMAEKVSSANTIQIEVIDHGLEKPLENSLEIALFRIIQELTTNIIKHAQANHATINISLDEEDITVLIEDNGIGMNASQIDLEKGMGLYSIKTRVEHLEGTFTIDSTPTKGTTIIINIPT